VADAGPKKEKRTVFRLAAVGIGLLPLVLLEAGLRLFLPADDHSDPYAGFGGNVPVFNLDGDAYRTANGREPFLAPQEFSATKSTNGLRVFCFGGSTVFGRPFHSATAFPRWLELQLQAESPGRRVEVVNCGGISYASYRIVPMLRECLQYEPDVMVLATGHNEFLEDRTYSSLKARSAITVALDSLRIVRTGRKWLARTPQKEAPDARNAGFVTRLDAESGYASYKRDPEWRRRVLTQFEEAIQQIIRDCRAAAVPLLIVRLGSNLRDCPPFKSEHRANLSADEEAHWQLLIDQARDAEKAKPSDAMEYYRQALEIDAEHALTHYRMARVLDRLDDPKAAEHYYEAKDEDVCPLRMFESQANYLKVVAEQYSLPFVDADSHLRDLSNEGLPGFDWYLDHVHPTIGGHQEIALLIADALRRRFPDLGDKWDSTSQRTIYENHFSGLRFNYLSDGGRRLDWLEDWARRAKLADEVLPNSADGFVRLGVRRMDFGALPEALFAFSRAVELDGSVRDKIREHRAQMRAYGRGESANAIKDSKESGNENP
tara:strand:+ start:2395 stop:4032 length:1638 start_codon:yes stop_codon:yes gene_type:complete